MLLRTYLLVIVWRLPNQYGVNRRFAQNRGNSLVQGVKTVTNK